MLQQTTACKLTVKLRQAQNRFYLRLITYQLKTNQFGGSERVSSIRNTLARQ